jgi:glutaminyl-peptide cyclotransferase
MKWESDETVAVGGIQVIFFDGEEAYLEWTEEDSIYGARHLAEKMANTEYPTKRRDSELNAIDVLVLLDLIGMPNANSFVSFFNSTDWLHANLDSIQERLYRLQMCNNSNRIFPRKPFFEYGGLFLDDHIPFFKLGVPTLHLIPAQFPDQWHTMVRDCCLDGPKSIKS